ncbi:MAG: beta-N-acetylhexosaminidase [Magnetospiraceae bacterium]
MTGTANSSRPRAAIIGVAGPVLGRQEQAWIRDLDPLGFILFARNCETPDQVRRLISDLRETVGRTDAPILIDQEGGRVARLGPPHWRKTPSATALAETSDPQRATYVNARLMAADLTGLGITVDCAPVLDILRPETDGIIGDRAHGNTADAVISLASMVCEGLLDGGVLPVIKHIPGHGRATVDSHLTLPVVEAGLNTLRETDFRPFTALRDMPWAMTAHVVYADIDPADPATTSVLVLQSIIREDIGFGGVLISDDLSMKALQGPFETRTRRAFAAGCDLALHCNGDADEARAVLSATPPLSEATVARLARAEAMRRNTPFDPEEALQELAQLLPSVMS